MRKARVFQSKIIKGGEIKQDITSSILRTLSNSIIEENSLSFKQILNAFAPKSSEERNRIWKAVKYLENKDRIKIFGDLGERTISLTVGGHNAIREIRITELCIEETEEWDREWRLVLLDIPGSHERKRFPMRQKLLELGFLPYQRSVFIYPYECEREVREVANYFEMEEFVSFVRAKSISRSEEFEKAFRLHLLSR